MKTKTKLTFDMVYHWVEELSYSQGRYGRMLRSLMTLTKEEQRHLIKHLKKAGVKSWLDFVLYVEQ